MHLLERFALGPCPFALGDMHSISLSGLQRNMLVAYPELDMRLFASRKKAQMVDMFHGSV
jgi:hypothetical protein